MSTAESFVYAACGSALVKAQNVASELLSDEELSKLASLRFPRRRTDWMMGRITAKQILIQTPRWIGLAMDIRKTSVRNEPEGAPYFYYEDIGRLPGNLSISHSDAKAFCAWTEDAEFKIGVDIEQIESRGDIPLETYFGENEITRSNAYPTDLRDAWITLMWSIKEAVLKGLGIGLRVDIRLVEIGEVQGQVSDADGEWRSFQVKYNAGRWNGFWLRRGDTILTIAGMQRTDFKWSIEEIHLDP